MASLLGRPPLHIAAAIGSAQACVIVSLGWDQSPPPLTCRFRILSCCKLYRSTPHLTTNCCHCYDTPHPLPHRTQRLSIRVPRALVFDEVGRAAMGTWGSGMVYGTIYLTILCEPIIFHLTCMETLRQVRRQILSVLLLLLLLLLGQT